MNKSFMIVASLLVAMSAGAQQYSPSDISNLPDGSYLCTKHFKHCGMDKKNTYSVGSELLVGPGGMVYPIGDSNDLPISGSWTFLQPNWIIDSTMTISTEDTIPTLPAQFLKEDECLTSDAKGNVVSAPCNATNAQRFDFTDIKPTATINYDGILQIQGETSGPFAEVLNYDKPGKEAVIVNGTDKSYPIKLYTIIRMTDDEYSKLQDLQKTVDDYKLTILREYNVSVEINPCFPGTGNGTTSCEVEAIYRAPADTYEFRGQFILVNLPSTK